MSEVTRILIIRFSSIGDIVLTTPVIRRLKLQLEGEVEIHFLTKEIFVSLLQDNPYLDKIHTIKTDVSEVLEELKAWDFNYVVDLHSNIRSNQVKRALKSFAFTFHKVNIAKWFFVNFGIDQLPETHIVDRYMASIKAFNLKDDGLGLDYLIPVQDRFDTSSLPDFAHKGFIAMAVGAAHEGKRMSTAQMIDTIDLCQLPVILIGDIGDQKVATEIFNRSKDGTVVDMTGKCSLHQSASIIEQSEVVVSGDTGAMHIAAAFGKKVVSVWGCTSPRFGMPPYRAHTDSIILEPLELKKRPCSKLGNRCKYGMENRCITHVSPQEISNAVNSLIGS